MERRGFLQRLVGGAVAGAVVSPVVGAAAGRYGAVTIDRHRHLSQNGVHLHVYCQGEDVTRECLFVDDTPGHRVARLLKRDSITGKHYIEDGEAATEDVTDFDLREGEPFGYYMGAKG